MRNGTSNSGIRIRKFRSLNGRAKEEAQRKYKDIQENDLVVVTTKIGSLPTYEIEKIEGDPLKFLFDMGKRK